MSNVVCLPYTNRMTNKDYNVSIDLDKRTFIRFIDGGYINIDEVTVDTRAADTIKEKLKTLNWIKGYSVQKLSTPDPVTGATEIHTDSYVNPALVLTRPMYFTLDGLSVEIDSSVFDGDSMTQIKAMISN